LPDGLLGITCQGERKFSVSEHWQQEDGLHLADVEFSDPEEPVDLPLEYDHLGDLLRKVLPELGELYANVPKRFSNASWWAAGWPKSCRLLCQRNNTAGAR